MVEVSPVRARPVNYIWLNRTPRRPSWRSRRPGHARSVEENARPRGPRLHAAFLTEYQSAGSATPRQGVNCVQATTGSAVYDQPRTTCPRALVVVPAASTAVTPLQAARAFGRGELP